MELLDAQLPTLAQFDAKAGELLSRITSYGQDLVDDYDDPELTGVPRGSAGSLLGVGNPISSKQVVRASSIVEECIGIRIPPVIIRKGGYETAESFAKHIMTGLRKVVSGEIKCKPKKSSEMVEL